MSFPMDWLNPPKKSQASGTYYKVVELSSQQRISRKTDKEVQESVQTLQSHPGFLYLLQRFDAQASLLKAKLTGERHETLDEVHQLQAGIFWANWLRQELYRSISRPLEQQIDPYEEELKAFKEIDDLLERVGGE
jgi:hypothetical protein